MSQTVTLLGATGLVGGHILNRLLNDPLYSEIIVINRRSLNRQHPKLKEFIFDFKDPKQLQPMIAGSETVFCAIGTTNKKVEGDKEEYQKIDFEIAYQAAKASVQAGVYGFVLISAVGANPENNNNFYLKLKGVTEEAVSKELIPQLIFLRPSVLLGKRDESRIAEGIAQFLMPAVSWLLPASMSKYKSIKAELVAEAAVNAAQKLPRGIHILEYDQMMKLANPDKVRV
jgi:uncharacterized protein YbjT (DUF2867 family)